MFQGLRTNIFRLQATDLDKAKAWYTQLIGQKPYFDEPFYVGFNVGGFELGLDPAEGPITLGNNVQVYWGVKDIKKAFAKCLELNAEVDSEIRNVGGDIQVATIRDPFGNILGLIENPDFKLSN